MNQALRLLELLGEVNDRYIEASCEKPKKKPGLRLWPYAAAAVLALALIGGGGALLRWGGAGSAAPEETMAASAAAEDPAEYAQDSAEKAEETAEEIPEAAENGATDTAQAAGEAATEEDRDGAGTDPAAADYLMNLTVGPLYLGMPESEVLSSLGEPKEKSNSPITREDGITILSWFYSGYSIQMADAGDGYVVNEIFVGSDGDLTLPEGIGIGSTEEAVAALGLPFSMEESTGYVGDDTGLREVRDVNYILTAGSRTLDISTEDGVVTCMRLGCFYPEPEFDWDDWNEGTDMPYDMSGDPITVYVRQEDGWQEVELTGKDAKRLEVILNIEELQPADPISQARYVLDFHNGTVAVLSGEGERGAVYTCLEGNSFSPSMLDMLDESLILYMDCAFPAGVLDTVETLTAP